MNTPEQMKKYDDAIVNLSYILNKNKFDYKLKQTRLVKLSEIFVCQICGKGSLKPQEKKVRISNYLDIFSLPCEETVIDWNEPGDMQKCSTCHTWVCTEHINQDICYECDKK